MALARGVAQPVEGHLTHFARFHPAVRKQTKRVRQNQHTVFVSLCQLTGHLMTFLCRLPPVQLYSHCHHLYNPVLEISTPQNGGEEPWLRVSQL